LTESKEAHRVRMRIKRSHPDWTNEMIRNEIKKILQSSQSGSQVHKSSQNQENEGSQEFTKGSQNHVKGSSQVHKSSQREPAKIKKIKIDHACAKSQYVISEEFEGKWRFQRTLGQNGEIDLPGIKLFLNWHRGDREEDKE